MRSGRRSACRTSAARTWRGRAVTAANSGTRRSAPPTPAPHGTRPVLAANQGHGMSFFLVYADRILAILQVLCSIPRQFGYGGSDANLRTCIGGGLGASIQAGNAAEGITLNPWCSAWLQCVAAPLLSRAHVGARGGERCAMCARWGSVKCVAPRA